MVPDCPASLRCLCRYLPPHEVAAVLRSCSVGGMFSGEEGTCYAVTEYLLCGLPVVTTASVGGRHVWLSEQNSIVVEPTPQAVAQGVQLALQKLCHGEFDRASIRRQAVRQAEGFRAEFVCRIQQICTEHSNSSSSCEGLQVDAPQLLRDLGARHKLGLM